MTAIQRAEAAQNYFEQGYNCAQAVALAFEDIFGVIGTHQIAALTSGFGGGMGRMREVCGAFSACVMVAGQLSPACDPSNIVERKLNYALVQRLADQFKERNGGSIICRELLGLSQNCPKSAQPSERSVEYYQKRPCSKTVYNAALILAEEIENIAKKQ